jgi:mono/diheme cytochrome c family protein
VFLLGLLLASANGCRGRRLAPVQPVVPIGEASQRSLLPADPYADARRAIGERYERRERMFRELWQPGSLWDRLRIEQADIDSGRLSLTQVAETGKELFTIDFDSAHGLGNGLSRHKSPLAGSRPAPNLRHVQYKQFGGPDATRCAACHHLGGLGGGGFRIDNAFFDGDGLTPASGLERNPRPLLGAAVLQQLAEEMTTELRTQALRLYGSLPPGGSAPLSAKGVQFGKVRRTKTGALDLTAVRGVGMDLVVRPFGWKGSDEITLRGFVERSLQQHLGIQSEGLIRRLRQSEKFGPSVNAQLGEGPPDDPDDDGITREATDGMVTALTLFIASLALPTEASADVPTLLILSGQGEALFDRIGCASCHIKELPLSDTVVSLGPTPQSRPRVDLSPLLISPIRSGRAPGVRLFSDLKRHDMGDGLAEARGDHGLPRNLWMTPPLWGLAASAPYLHDGRAGNIQSAIYAHGGEALPAVKAYDKLSTEEKGAVGLFLLSQGRPHVLEFKP